MSRELLSVQLLGGFNLRCGGVSIGSLPRKPASLLAYLVMNRDRPQTRDLLAGRFWSDLPEDRARKRLSNALWQIRTALDPLGLVDLVETSSTTVQLSSQWELDVDVDEFEGRLDDVERQLSQRSARGPLLEKLVELIDQYPGDFLAGHYADWIDSERSRLKDRYTDAFWQTIKLYKARSDYTTALRYARQLVTHDPLSEESHREVMRLCSLLGQSAAAERQYQTCRRILEDELGVEPSWETSDLIERIRQEASNAKVPLAALDSMESPIVGRSRERAILLGRVDDLMAGTGGLVLIEGEPGIGKSRMVEDLIDSADWRGARVLSAAHTELSRLRPYQGLYDALAPATTGLRGEHLAEVIDQVWLQNASEVFPDLRQFLSESTIRRALRPEEEPSRMNEALARVLLAQGGLGPTVIILEDVHWCDDDSMQVFANIGERLSRSGVLICLTYRRFEAEQAQEVWSVISNLEASTAVSRVVLGLLNNAEAREIITDQVGPGVLPNRVIEQLVEDSGGNPLYLREALRDPEALLRSEDAMALPHEDSGNFPATVARALHQRLAVLPDHVRTVIQAIAVLAEPCSSQLVAKITGLDRRLTLGGLNEAVSRGFLVELGDGICRFNHDQTRRAIYHAVDEDEILGWHHQIFQALAASDDPQPEQLAYHADLAQMWHQASQWHTVAAHAAQEVNAFGVAAEHYRQADEAARLAEVPITDRIADLLDYEQVLDVLGRREDQQDLLKRLLDLDLPLESQVDLAERQAWLLGHIDRHDEAAQLATEWADRAFDAGLPTYRLLSALGVVRYWSGSHLEAIDALRRALKAAPDDQSRVTIENHLGRTLIDMSEFDEGNELVADARAKAERLGDVRSQVESLIHQSISAVRRGQPTEAIEYAEQSLPLSRSIGYRYGEGVSLVNLANIRSGQGRAGMALPMYGEAAEVFDSLGNARAKAIIRFNLGEFYHSFLGENDEAATFFNSAAAYCKAVGDQRTEMLAMSKISSIDWQSGRRRLARQRLKRLIERSIEIGDTHVELEARRIAAECASSADEPEEAIEQLDLAIKLIEENAMGQVHAHALAHRGLATLRAGDDEEAIDYVERSALANTPESEFGLITAWRCGTVFKAVGRDQDAAAQFDLAFRLLESNLTGLEPERAASARTLPQFAAIIEAYELEFVRQIEINLPSIEAPIGRTLEPNEYETVTWTLSTPADWEHSVASTRRRNRISRLCAEAVVQEAVARIYDLATVLSVSERTIKRDLSELRAMGESPKTRRSA